MSSPDTTKLSSVSSQMDPSKEKKVEEEGKAGKEAQGATDNLKKQAADTNDKDEKEKLLGKKKADEREKEAPTHTKKASRIASSIWQGTMGGAGVETGAAIETGAVAGI